VDSLFAPQYAYSADRRRLGAGAAESARAIDECYEYRIGRPLVWAVALLFALGLWVGIGAAIGSVVSLIRG
jgi:hypothetical protein